MRLDPARPPVRHKVGNRFAVAADDKRFAGILHGGEQAGKIGFRFVNVDCFHCRDISPVSPLCQRVLPVALRLREIPAGRRSGFRQKAAIQKFAALCRAAATDEKRRRSDGHRAHVQGKPAKMPALARDRPQLRQERNLCSHPRHPIPQPRRGGIFRS